MASVMRMTSKPFCLKISRKGESRAPASESAATVSTDDERIRRTGEVVDVLLHLGHARDVLFERGLVLARLGRRVAQHLGQLDPVGRVLVDAELEVLGEGLVELGKVVLVLGDLREELHALLDEAAG